MDKTKHLKYMQQALELSKAALPNCLPNPPVGCIIVKDDQIIGKGFTQKPGDLHAEAIAIKDADGEISGSHVYVTLEPCSFHGRTPSCAKSLAESQISEIFIGVLDPDPRNNGNGLKILQDANIRCTTNLLQDQIEEFLKPYLM